MISQNKNLIKFWDISFQQVKKGPEILPLGMSTLHSPQGKGGKLDNLSIIYIYAIEFPYRLLSLSRKRKDIQVSLSAIVEGSVWREDQIDQKEICACFYKCYHRYHF